MHDDQERYMTMTRIVNGIFLLKTIAGTLLMIMGGVFAMRILSIIFKIIRSPLEISLVDRLAQVGNGEGAINIFGESLTISPETFAYGNIMVSYAIIIILLAIGGGIAKVFLYTGSSLIQSGIESLLEKFRDDR
ncbi:MAG: hypothetical protein O7G88_07740 [bacterium]|nr:hypothetical protein [bacterium]